MAFWFMGSGGFAARCLDQIVGSVPISLVVTNVPSKAGRGLKERPTPVDILASSLKLNVHRTSNLSKDELLIALLKDHSPEGIFVIDFGHIVDEPYLSWGKVGCLNVHPSLLPRYRGAAPVQRAIMNGDRRSGITVFKLVKKMDAGPILLQEEVEIPINATAGEMLEFLAVKGGKILLDALQLFLEGKIVPKDQREEEATYAPKIDKAESKLSWDLPSEKFHNIVRALNPNPGAYLMYRGKRLKIWKTLMANAVEGAPGQVVALDKGFPVVSCGEGAVTLMEVQMEGRKRQDGASWFLGAGLKEGDMIL